MAYMSARAARRLLLDEGIVWGGSAMMIAAYYFLFVAAPRMQAKGRGSMGCDFAGRHVSKQRCMQRVDSISKRTSVPQLPAA
jgi:hypothetical protein